MGIGSFKLNFLLSLGSITSLTVSNTTIDEIPIPAVIRFASFKWDAIPIHSCMTNEKHDIKNVKFIHWIENFLEKYSKMSHLFLDIELYLITQT
jgi:hypothetical protein